VSPELVALHLGALHPYEQLMTLALAFGPFLVLAAVIAIRRRGEEDVVDDVDPADPLSGA
jgi:hypothetical protein